MAMLIISNGAFKSGSTWLFNIVRYITGFAPPPKAYLNPGWINPSISPKKLEALLKEVDHKSRDSLVKNHFRKQSQKHMLLSYSSVRVLDIRRELSDVVVSAYYHHRNKNEYRGSFHDYYWLRGRFIAINVQAYHDLWDIPSPQTYTSSFERLKADFSAEVRSIGNFFEKDLSDVDVENIRRETSLSSLRSKYDDKKFFRKGGSGYIKNYFTHRMMNDIDKIKRREILYSSVLSKVKERVRGTFFWGTAW